MLDTYVQRGRYKQYHSSLKLFISSGGSSAVAYDLNIPKSTVSYWKNTDFSKLISHPVSGSAENDLKLFKKFIKNKFAQRLFSVYIAISETFHSILQGFKESINSFKDTVLPVINNAKYTIGIANTLKIFRVSRQRYDSWIKNKSCSASPVGLCVRQYPNQLNKDEIAGLKELFSKFKQWRAMNSNVASGSWPLVSIYYKGLREDLISFSQTTFYKYVKLLGFSDFSETIKKKPQQIGLRAIFPNQYWHADVTIFRPLDHTKIYIYLVIDNFSRYILSWRASLELSAKIRWETVQEAYRISSVKNTPINLIVDGGPENKPIPFDPNIPIRKIVAQQDIIFSNSMIEAANKQLKYRYLFTQNLMNFDDTVRYLEKSIPEFNNIRPYGALKGLTPEEVYYKGMIPGKSPFDERLKQAIDDRYSQNMLNFCPICMD